MAEGHQVRFTVVTALSQRLDVMHLLCLDEPAFPLASLTKRVCIHVSVTDSLPCPAIFSFDGRVSIIFFIPFIFQPLMFLTESAIRQLWTAGIGTRPFRFPRHFATSLGHKKSPHRIAPMKAVLYSTLLL